MQTESSAARDEALHSKYTLSDVCVWVINLWIYEWLAWKTVNNFWKHAALMAAQEGPRYFNCHRTERNK